MILSCQNIGKAFGEKEILTDISFHLEEREKAALVGPNGTGKSTLLRIITRQIEADHGCTVFAKDTSLGYLEQHQELPADQTLYDTVAEIKSCILDMEEKLRSMEVEMKDKEGKELDALTRQYHNLTTTFENENGYAWRSEVTGVLKGLGFAEEDFTRFVSTLSGGQKTRLALGRLLLLKPDILLLDEPTNHLDIESIQWLETFLLHYPGAVLIVSHDRYFLDRIVTKVLDLDRGNLSVYQGNYSEFAKKKEEVRKEQLKAWLNQQQEIKHQEAVIAKLRSFNREKSIRRAESREKMLEKIKPLERPQEYEEKMRLLLEPALDSGHEVLRVEGLTKSWPNLPLFQDLSFQIRKGERVAIIGGNGTGKTTILQIINGLAKADQGQIRFGSKVRVGYYDQEHHVLHMEKTIFQEIADSYPDLTETRIRNVLAAFLFTGDEVFKPIAALSGGERGRLSLARLMLSNANFLILDEPTNHLDIPSREILEEALRQYKGTVLYVSHDRYFINRTATKIMDLVNQTLVPYLGDYDYYLEKKDELTLRYAPPAGSPENPQEGISQSKLSWQEEKELLAKERKRKNDLKKIEDTILSLEKRDKEIDDELSLPEVAADAGACIKLAEEQADLQLRLTKLYEEWELLAE